MSDKRPETDADILSRSTELSYDFATGARQSSRRYHHDLVGHMAECDMNFQRLMQLFPTVREDDFKCVMLLPGEAGTRVELSVPEGFLMIYGPFMRNGKLTSQGDIDFDKNIRKNNINWGYKNDITLLKLFLKLGFLIFKTIEMPANNLAFIVKKLT